MPKYTHYEPKLNGDKEIIAFLKPHLPTRFATIREFNAKRRAVVELFSDAVDMKIISVQRLPAKTTRRLLRL